MRVLATNSNVFVVGVMAGKVKEHFKSENPPEVTKHAPGKVMKVVGKNFNDTLNIGKDVLIESLSFILSCSHFFNISRISYTWTY